MRSINDFKTSSVLWSYFPWLIAFNCVYVIIVPKIQSHGISGLTFWKCQLNNCNQVVNTSTHKWKHLIAASRLLHSSFLKLNWFDTTSVKSFVKPYRQNQTQWPSRRQLKFSTLFNKDLSHNKHLFYQKCWIQSAPSYGIMTKNMVRVDLELSMLICNAVEI